MLLLCPSFRVLSFPVKRDNPFSHLMMTKEISSQPKRKKVAGYKKKRVREPLAELKLNLARYLQA